MAGEDAVLLFTLEALVERARRMWRGGPGLPVRSGLAGITKIFTKSQLIIITQVREELQKGGDLRVRGVLSLEQMGAFIVGDVAGLPVMPGVDAITLGEKINKEAKKAKEKIAAIRHDSTRKLGKLKKGEDRAPIEKDAEDKSETVRAALVDPPLKLPAAARCAAVAAAARRRPADDVSSEDELDEMEQLEQALLEAKQAEAKVAAAETLYETEKNTVERFKLKHLKG